MSSTLSRQFGRRIAAFAIVGGLLVSSDAHAQTTVTVEWTGGDSHAAFAVAKNAAGVGGTIRVPPSPTGDAWILEQPFNLQIEGQTLSVAEGVTIITKAADPTLEMSEQPFASIFSPMFRILGDGITIIGEGAGATLQMRRDEFADPNLYDVSSDPFRHCISIRGTNNFLVENLDILDSGADGVAVGPGVNQFWSEGVVRNIRVDNPYRLGMSCVSTKSLLVEDCIFTNANGVNPQAGLDIEPDDELDFCEGIVIRDCGFMNNARRDLTLQLFNFHPEPENTTFDKPIDITIERCRTSGSGQDGFYIALARDRENGVFLDAPTSGQIVARECAFKNALLNEVTLAGVRADSVPVIFENLIIETEPINIGFPIAFQNNRRDGHGNVHFNGACQVIDCVDRPVIANASATSMPALPGVATIQNVTGTLDVATPFEVRGDLGESTENVTILDGLFANLVKNFGFEHFKYGWEDLGGCAISTDAFSGDRAVRIPDGTLGVKQDITEKLIPGETYVLRAASKGLIDSGSVAVTFQDSDGHTFACPGFLVAGSDYTQAEVEFITPPVFETAFIELVPFLGGEFFVDDVIVEKQ